MKIGMQGNTFIWTHTSPPPQFFWLGTEQVCTGSTRMRPGNCYVSESFTSDVFLHTPDILLQLFHILFATDIDLCIVSSLRVV